MSSRKSNAKKKPLKRKITAMVPKDLIKSVENYASKPTLTESLIVALEDWVRIKRFHELHERIKKKPLQFSMTWQELKEVNRKIT